MNVVLITAPKAQVAHKLAAGLVRNKLAACVNVVPGVVSHYRWEGKVRKDRELLLIAKTADPGALEKWVKANHPYSVPEVVVLKIAGGSKEYLSWAKAACR